jgi:putative ABC transport system ATP-binding protein
MVKNETAKSGGLAAVRVRNLTKSYGTDSTAVQALRGVDFEAQRGELVMLMGPSGSGKTTLLSIMGCILRATSGLVEIEGRDVTKLDERELPRLRLGSIGFVFQGFNLFPALTGGENIALAFELKGYKRFQARRAAHELLAQVGLEDKVHSYPADLSGGQKQRVAIARALAGDPLILLADEPTAALDSTSGRAVIELLQRLAHEHSRAVVMVTHDPRVLSYGDRILHLEDGRLLREETLLPGSPAASSLRTSQAAANFSEEFRVES